VALENVFALGERFYQVPAQAIRARLAGIKLGAGVTAWTERHKDYFSYLTRRGHSGREQKDFDKGLLARIKGVRKTSVSISRLVVNNHLKT